MKNIDFSLKIQNEYTLIFQMFIHQIHFLLIMYTVNIILGMKSFIRYVLDWKEPWKIEIGSPSVSVLSLD